MITRVYAAVKYYLPLALLVAIGSLLSYYARYNEIWEGGGDNYWHYYLSKYAFSKPEFFLHHWGKPFFILLSAPFSQFGFYALNLFNILCGLASAYVCYLFCRELEFRIPWFVIIILLFAPLYFLIVQSGMTEPLFSLALVASSYLLFREKYVTGAILASFLMYARTEGAFIQVTFAGYLLLAGRWKFIPLLGTAFSLYSLAGFFSGHDLLWFFTENPYAEESVYGHGYWSHFFEKYEVIWGIPHLVLLGAGLATLLFGIIRNGEYKIRKPLGKNIKVALLVLVPAVLYSFFHVYAWAMGKYASAGLERVFSCILPYTSLLGMYAVNLFCSQPLNAWVKGLVIAALVFFINRATTTVYKYPMGAFGPEKVERRAAKWFSKERKPGYTVYYAHPAILFFCDYNPYAPENQEARYFPNDCHFKDTTGFYYVWDNFFSESAFHTKLEDLKKCPNLALIKSFDIGENFVLHFFEYKPQK